jgi:hypothetical protein
MKRRERQGRNRREEEEDEGDEVPAKRRRNIEEKVISQVFHSASMAAKIEFKNVICFFRDNSLESYN